jgi:hypothetical protein
MIWFPFSPEEFGFRNREGYKILSVDGHGRTLLGRRLALALLVPFSESDFPQRQCQQSGCLAKVIRSDEDHGVTQFNLDRVKSLEVRDREFCEHFRALKSYERKSTKD